MRLVVDPATKEVVYTTADFHKPWNIGVTPDAQIQAYIDELNADQDVADYITAHTPVSPYLQGRITCIGATCPAPVP